MTNWKQRFQGDQDELKALKEKLEQTEERLDTEMKQNREKDGELERLRGDLFDLQNERAELIHQAALGRNYHDQLIGLQSELP